VLLCLAGILNIIVHKQHPQPIRFCASMVRWDSLRHFPQATSSTYLFLPFQARCRRDPLRHCPQATSSTYSALPFKLDADSPLDTAVISDEWQLQIINGSEKLERSDKTLV
jgi:hypothetical protein